jgi:autotransporter-associated beta strand protein
MSGHWREMVRNTWMIAALAITSVLASHVAAVAQISVDATILTSGYTQNFDSMGTSGTATLPTGWKMTAAGAGTTAGWSTVGNLTAVSAQASSGSPTSGGRYNWGSSTTDRAAGFMTSGSYASPNGLLFGLTNTTTNTITGLTLAFDYERYRINTAAASATFFSSTDGSTWSAVTAGDSGSFATGTSSYTFSDGTVVSKSGIAISSLNIGQNQSFYLKWNFSTTGSNSQGIGLDNFGATFTSTGGSVTYYWVGDDTTLGGSGTWSQTGGTSWRSTDTDGTGEAWDSAKVAVFGGTTAGTVTVSDTVNANAGIQFATSGYTVSGGTVSMGQGTMTTDASATATVFSVVAGTAGLTKAGAGTLVLDAANTFSGNVAVNAGTLEINSDADLGDSTNDVAVSGTLRTTATAALGAGRDLSGSGTLDIAAGTTLTVNGATNMTGLTLTNTGTLSLQGATRSVGNLAINAPLTIQASGAVSATGLTASGLTSGTATIAPAVVLTSGDKTVNVPGTGTLVLEGDISGLGTNRLAKTGTGTLVVDGPISAGGLRVGSTGSSPTNGGNVVLGQASSVGSTTLQLNYGTLSTTAEGGIVTTQGVSLGGRTGAVATLGGSEPITFNGPSSFFRGTGTSGELRLDVNNETTLGGGFAATSGSGTATGITIGGSGKLTLAGDGSALVDAITLQNSLDLLVEGSLGSAVTVGATNALGGDGTIGGNLSLLAGAGFIFTTNKTLTVNGASVTFGNFGVSDLIGFSAAIPDGTYTLIDGLAVVSTTNLRNLGAANAYDLGSGRSAYFETGSLVLQVVPEPSSVVLAGLGGLLAAGYAARRRRPLGND